MYAYVYVCMCMYVYVCVSVRMSVCVSEYSHFHNDLSFFSSIKKTEFQIPEPKRTGSVFVLSVRYQYRFFFC
jgi:hypothetical protein